MPTIIHDKQLEERLQAERAATGANRYDEVWEGTYMMAPMPNNEHQLFVARLTRILDELISDNDQGIVLPGANISDRIEDWQNNYRVPDVAVFLSTNSKLRSTPAENHGTFWLGGPDLAIEILSANDQAREKLDFYSHVETQELLVIDRDPWQIELYQFQGKALELTAQATPHEANEITLQTCALQLKLESQPVGRPRLTATSQSDDKSWRI